VEEEVIERGLRFSPTSKTLARMGRSRNTITFDGIK
jgi:hypothetical protein